MWLLNSVTYYILENNASVGVKNILNNRDSAQRHRQKKSGGNLETNLINTYALLSLTIAMARRKASNHATQGNSEKVGVEGE